MRHWAITAYLPKAWISFRNPSPRTISPRESGHRCRPPVEVTLHEQAYMRGLEVFLLAGVATLAAGTISPASAQRPGARGAAHPEIGLRAGRDFSVDTWTAGAHIRIPFGGTLEFRPSADLALKDIG